MRVLKQNVHFYGRVFVIRDLNALHRNFHFSLDCAITLALQLLKYLMALLAHPEEEHR